MNTYTLITIEETTIAGDNISSVYYTIPVDNNNNPVTDYTTKNRILRNNQMLVFDTYEEYRNYIESLNP
jgi:hypothetical protein